MRIFNGRGTECASACLTLCSADERSNLNFMKVLCTILIILLGVASPMSLWADVVVPCTQQDQPSLRGTFISMPTHADMAMQNDRDSTQETNLHHGNSTDGDSSAIDCECCVSCISACASSAGTHTAIGSESGESFLANKIRPEVAANCIHSNPDPRSPFRPPQSY